MSIINSLISAVYSSRLKKIEQMATEYEEMQSKQFLRLLKWGSHTCYGHRYGFSSIDRYTKFKQQVPVVQYERIAPYIERCLKGEKSVLWPGRIKWFAKSSGTTDAKSKYIPVTKESLHRGQYKGGIDCIATYISQHPDSKIYNGKCLTLGGSKKLVTEGKKAQTGDLSAIMIGNAPSWSNRFKTPDKDIALLSDWEEKLEKITAATVKENVTSLTGVPSWFLILLEHIMKTQGVSNIQEVWPNLELFIHGGINFEPYRERYNAIAPKGLNYLETYNASEGFFAIQTDPNDRGLQLMLDYGVFYEFVPLDEVGEKFPTHSVPITDVHLNRDYALVISTNGGLWRYMIGDTVRFVSRNPYKIIISGRTKLYINAFGEELMIGNAEAGLKKACAETGAVVREYTAAPIFMDKDSHGCHQWLIEFDKAPEDVEQFANILDSALQEVNSDYEAKRYKDVTLNRLQIVVARQGLFYDWMNSKGKLGGQNKVPRLKNDRTIIDDILLMNN